MPDRSNTRSYLALLPVTGLLVLQIYGSALGLDLPAPNDSTATGQEFTEGSTSSLYMNLHDFKGFGVREFNRVDGLALSFGMTIGGRYSETSPKLDASVLYYTDRGRPGWVLDLYKSFERLGYFTTGLVYKRNTTTYDRWRMGDLESSLASFALKESFRNYYECEGISVYFTTELNDWFVFRTAYDREDHRSIEAGNPFTIPGNAKSFRQNPTIDDGTQSALSFTLTYDSRDNIRLPHSGWFHEGYVEISSDRIGSDFNYTRWFLNLRRYHPIGFGQFLNLRLVAAGTSGQAPGQRTLTAGGVGTLRGYEDNSLSGDHMVLANAEYRFPIGLLRLKPVLIIFNELHGMLFLDTGRLWYGGLDDESEVLADAGIGLSGANFMSYFGLYVAWPMTGNNEGARITIKIVRDF